MNEPVYAKTTLAEWLDKPPTVVIYRPDGQISLDQLPDMASPDAVVCFTTMEEAKRLLKESRARGFRAVNLSVEKWLDALEAETHKGRTHLSIWEIPGDGTLQKRSVRIKDVLNGFAFAANAVQEATEKWRWN